MYYLKGPLVIGLSYQDSLLLSRHLSKTIWNTPKFYLRIHLSLAISSSRVLHQLEFSPTLPIISVLASVLCLFLLLFFAAGWQVLSVCSFMTRSLIMGFKLTPDSVLVSDSVWNLVASIYKTHLSFLLIDLLGTLVENPVTPDTVWWVLSIPFRLCRDLDLATLWIYRISGTQAELVFLTHKMAISQNRIKWFHIWDLMVFLFWSWITVTVRWCATLHQSTSNDESQVSYAVASFWYVIRESTWTGDVRWSD